VQYEMGQEYGEYRVYRDDGGGEGDLPLADRVVEGMEEGRLDDDDDGIIFIYLNRWI
jgi:hypothetical protein